MRHVRTFAATALVLAVAAALTVTHAPATRAQDAKAAAEQYLANVILKAGDVPGYKLRAEAVEDASDLGAVAARSVIFDADPFTSQKVQAFQIWVYVFPSVDGAHQNIASIRNNRSYTETGTGAVVSVRWDGSLTGVEEGESYRFTRQYPDRRNDAGTGAGWRRGVVFFRISAFSRPGHEIMDETLRLASVQNSKAARTGPYTPPAPPVASTPAAPASPPPDTGTQTATQPAEPDMNLLVTVRTGGAMARDGTVVRALIGGQECGRATTVLGFTLLAVPARSSKPGCGADGTPITFNIGDTPANETTMWSLDNLAMPVALTAAGRLTSGLLVRPTLDVSCIAAEGECSDQERLLWAGNFDAWFAELQSRGIEPKGESMLRAWMQFRADRGEVFGSLALAFLEQRPYTFILAVRHTPSDDEPVPYVALFSFGADRPVGGWTLRTGGASYGFPTGMTLKTGACRVYAADPSVAVEVANTCPGAILSGASPAIDAHGYVELVDESGNVVDSVAY